MPRFSRSALLRLALLPAALLMLAFFYYPLVRIAGLSVDLPALSFAEYAKAFNPVNLAITFRTFSIAVSITLASLALGYPLAAFVHHARGRMKKLVTLCILVPFLTSFLVRSYAWVVLLGDEGAINGALLALGIVHSPLELLYSRTGMYIGMIHVMLPLMALPIYASMQASDPLLWRAARGLGSGGLRAFLTVYLPQTMAGVRSGCILVFVLSLGFYITPAMLGASRDLMLGNLIANNVESSLNFGFASALAIVLLAVTLLVYVVMRLLAPSMPSAGGGAGGGRLQNLVASFNRRIAAVIGGRSPAVILSGIAWRAHAGRSAWAGGAQGGRWLLFAFGWLVCLYLVIPSFVVAIVAFNKGDSLAFPPTEWSLRWFRFLFNDAQWAQAMGTSLRIALVSVVLTLAVGTAAAYGIARLSHRREGRILYALALAPMVVPAVVTALGAFAVLSDIGLYGTLTGVIVMHVCLSIPLVVVVMVAAFSSLDTRLEMAAQSLGASRTFTFRRVLIPLLSPALLSAALLAFLHSFDDLVMTSFIAGNGVITIPLKMWENIRNQVDPAVAALSTLLVLLPFLSLLLQRKKAVAPSTSVPATHL
ncbi:ABC transporter permease subunit [Variovorax sp. GB1R11]|uniref:ABC transporter permease subunit n=1 Tax=Variovorax sp. GB1R11 TaxID=3443741 RepID=UPI003F451E5C